MKKMLTFLIATILILAMSLMPLQAITGINSLVSYGEGNEIEGGCNGKNVDLGEGLSGLMVSNQSELVFIGNDDFKIKVGKPVKEFEIIDDVDNDGLKDVAVYIDVKMIMMILKSLVQKLQKYYMLQNILITRLMIIMRQ